MTRLVPARRPEPAGGWAVVLPLKGGRSAKSRLGGGPDLAAAIALDCLDAVLACPSVTSTVVVTADQATATAARAAGGTVVSESHPGGGLVAAVRDGVADAARSGAGRVAVLLGDLPALRPGDLTEALSAVGRVLAGPERAPMVVVADADGRGTVLLAAAAPADLDPAFGPGSFAEHVSRGAVAVDLDAPRLRHDVDTPDDLRVALALGVGPRTRALLAAERAVLGAADPSAPRRPYPGRVQATVHRFDPDSRNGSVVTDAGVLLPFDGTAFDASPLRLLRVGQRLTVVVEGTGRAARVTALALENVGVVAGRVSRP